MATKTTQLHKGDSRAEQSWLRIRSAGCKNANLKHANGLNVILKVADKSFVQKKKK